jgi:hypothetical protein
LFDYIKIRHKLGWFDEYSNRGRGFENCTQPSSLVYAMGRHKQVLQKGRLLPLVRFRRVPKAARRRRPCSVGAQTEATFRFVPCGRRGNIKPWKCAVACLRLQN